MMRIRPLPLTLALLLAAGPVAAHAEDLVQAYQEARASDPTLAGAEATRAATDEGVKQAWAALLPQVSAGYNYQTSHGSSTSVQPFTEGGNIVLLPYTRSQSSNSTTLTGTLTQTIFDFGKFGTVAASKAQARAGDATLDAARQNLLIRVATAYFNVLTSEDALKFSQANEKALMRQLDQAQQRFEVGLAAITDVDQAKAQADAARAGSITAQNALDDAREALRELTNKEVGDLKRLRDDLPLQPPTPNDQEAWVDSALKNNPALNSQRNLVAAANDNVKVAYSGHLPTLNAQILYQRNPSWSDVSAANGPLHTNSSGSDTAIGLTLNVPLFTGGFAQSKVRQAIYTRDATQDTLEQQRRDLIHQTRTDFRNVIAGISSVEANKQAVISAQSSVEATQAGFEVGTKTIIDVLSSQQALFQAQSSYSQARHAFVLNGLLLKQAAGTIEMKDLEAVNSLLQ